MQEVKEINEYDDVYYSSDENNNSNDNEFSESDNEVSDSDNEVSDNDNEVYDSEVSNKIQYIIYVIKNIIIMDNQYIKDRFRESMIIKNSIILYLFINTNR